MVVKRRRKRRNQPVSETKMTDNFEASHQNESAFQAESAKLDDFSGSDEGLRLQDDSLNQQIEIQRQQEAKLTEEHAKAAVQEKQIKKINSITFRVAGVTFENDKGKDIQSLLHKIGRAIAKEEDIPLYSGLTNSEIIEHGCEVAEFEDVFLGDYITFEKDPTNKHDKNAIKVFVNMPNGERHHIGHVPKDINVKVGELMDSKSIKSIDAYFVGGKIKEVDYDDEKDKEVVVVKELTLGVEITIFIRE